MYLCNSCGAKLVSSGKIKPLVEIWGANNVPWKICDCENCHSKERCMEYPDAIIIPIIYERKDLLSVSFLYAPGDKVSTPLNKAGVVSTLHFSIATGRRYTVEDVDGFLLGDFTAGELSSRI